MGSLLDIIFGKAKAKTSGRRAAKSSAKTKHAATYAPSKGGKGGKGTSYSPAQPASAARGRAAGGHQKSV